MKQAKYYTDGMGLLIQANFPINADEKQYRYFLDELETMEGVEKVQAGRYYVEMAFGFLFDLRTMVQQVCAAFGQVYRVPCTESISEEERAARLYQLAAEVNEKL